MFVGLTVFCLAVLAPASDFLSGLSVMNVAATGTSPTVGGNTLVMSGGLLLISVASTLFGFVLLLLRL
ncbi:hypothetical protein C440_04063 [Haloferax mucosum ATCC BAA-1512]|uniref:Uncharacterized protein n=1 Tax=Haloferax mucosum ATCC BAA-1512 TaxID=662479 RepID=M0IJI9_9EURY|nr:hypothetical protein C440_04063 [Haloferax mucosum ATCC BAA-1512]